VNSRAHQQHVVEQHQVELYHVPRVCPVSAMCFIIAVITTTERDGRTHLPTWPS
jgi:hypothetical protein